MEIKQVDEKGLNFIITEEECILHAYRDSAGIFTIGVGCTYYPDGTKVKMTDPPITKEKAIELFKTILAHYEQAVWSLTRDDINQNQFNALVAITYNIGIGAFKGSTLLKKVNANPNDPFIKECFEMWSKAGTDKNRLRPRRKREAALYFS